MGCAMGVGLLRLRFLVVLFEDRDEVLITSVIGEVRSFKLCGDCYFVLFVLGIKAN